MSTNGDQRPGMSWPGHEAGADDPRERRTRKPLDAWDRSKLLILLCGAWLVLLWNAMARNEGVTFQVAVLYAFRTYGWILALAGVEAIRQVHYLISEQSAAYHQFWSQRVFGRAERSIGRMDAWNRFRLSRVLKWLALLALLDLVLAQAFKVHPVAALFQLPIAIWQILPLGLQLMFAAFYLVIQFGAMFWFLSRGGVDTYMPEEIKTRFTDVWGQDQVLAKVKENIIFLEEPERIEERGGHVPGGLLLWGPPGTGKTLMAEAVAGETGKPFMFVEPGAFQNMFFGIGILKVKSLFRKLRKLALRHGGVIAFFDEADALGSRGGAVAGAGGWGQGPWSTDGMCNGLSYLSPNAASLVLKSSLDSGVDEAPRRGINRFMVGAGMGGGGMGTLQALLTELSGLKKPRGFVNKYVRRALGMAPKPPPKYRILVMMATNMPQALDDALLRPGRIDRIYKVGYPSKSGRIRTYEGYLAKVRHNLSQDEVDRLATITPYATGATIKDLVNEALINSIRDSRDWITWKDIIKAKLLKELGPPEDVEYIERERHAVAIHEACHAVVAYRVRRHLAIDIATIEKGSSYLGMVASIPLEEQFTQWKSEYESDIMVALAALAGEKFFFDGDSSSGVTADLQSATTIAMFMDGYWGMGSHVGSHAVVKRSQLGGQAIADTTRSLMESELGRKIETMLAQLLDKTRRLIEENRLEVLAVAHALEAHKTLTGEDVAAVIEGTVGPLVDGRPYRTPDFLQQAEAYHIRALDAHKQHGKVDLALPVFGSPTDPVAAWSSEPAVRPDYRPSQTDERP